MKPLALLFLGQLAQLGGAAVLPQNERSALEIATNGALLRREAPSMENHLQGLFKKSQEQSGPADTCNDNYMAGAVGTPDCSTNITDSTDAIHTSDRPAMLYKIQDPDMCQEAAKEDCKAKNATCVSDPTKPNGCEEDGAASPFEIDSCYYNNFPIGCFMRSNGKWGYNGAGNMPTKLGERPKRADGSDYPNGACPLAAAMAASPVCQRIEYINGTLDAGEGKCGSEDFAVIMNEDHCRTAATCLGYCSEDQFRVIAVNNSFPLGCFINPVSGCARFNSIPAQDPATVVGMPLCNLTLARGSEQAGGGSGG